MSSIKNSVKSIIPNFRNPLQFFFASMFILLIISCQKKTKEMPVLEKNESHAWWKESIIYQIYPRSFKDSNGDGIGDLKGIIQELDYIKSIGVTAVWLNPIYQSPNDDNGYDVSDYRDIMADFGTMADFDTLLLAMHEKGIKLIMDLVVNHSSDEHEWFKHSRSSRQNKFRDYYHWWPAEKGKPNYRFSLFDEKGDAWKFDSLTNAYYLHYFSQKQPDLNWENPNLRQEVYDIMKFWAEKGVDGFRLDAFQFAAKDTTFPKFPDGLEKNFMDYYAMQGDLHLYLKEMNDQVFSKYDVMSVAEGAGRNMQEAHELVDADRHELNMAYAFDGVGLANPEGYSLSKFKEVFSKWDSAFAQKGWLSIFLSNHDQSRLVNRFGNDDPLYRDASSKMLNTFILTMRGTPYCYYGDELAMTNIGFEKIEQYNDISAKNGYKKVVNEGGDVAAYMKNLKFSSRDNGRTPMQWNSGPQAGFTNAKPWLPVNDNHITINVESQNKDGNSVLNYFRKLTELRKNNKILVYGKYEIIQPEHKDIYAYTRSMDGKKWLVILNFKANNTEISIPELNATTTLIINNYDTINLKGSTLQMQPYQAILFELN